MTKHFFSVIGFLFIALLMTSASADVHVSINEKHYQYNHNPRLSEVLKPVESKDSYYWPIAKLFKKSSLNSIESERDRLIRRLANKGRDNNQIDTSYMAIINQLKSWDLAERVLIDIDYEHARYNIKHNPMFDDGHYQIHLSTRPESAYVFGAVEKSLEVSVTNNVCVADTISNIKSLPIADNSVVYVIQPNGDITKAPIASWNRKCILPMPGSVIYVPLQENQFLSGNSKINEDIARFALNRVSE